MDPAKDNYLSKISEISNEFDTSNINAKESQPPIEFLIVAYKDAIFSSVITSFALDMILFRDRRGGEVDTIHTVGDETVTDYALEKNKEDYHNRPDYDYKDYHGKKFERQKKRINAENKSSNLIDAYTGREIAPNQFTDVDHVVSGKETHDDPRRILAGAIGEEAANIDENLVTTNRSINRSKGCKSNEEYLDYIDNNKLKRKRDIENLKKKQENGTFTEENKKELNKLEQQELVDADKMRNTSKKADEAQKTLYEQKYYSSKKFHSATTIAAAKSGVKMGVREATGLIILDTWVVVEEEMPRIVEDLRDDFTLDRFFARLKDLFKSAYNRVYDNWKGYIGSFREGVLSGALASLTSTAINMFETTFATAGRILRQSWSSIIQAIKILVFNPDKLPFGEVLRSVFKIIGTTGSVIAGVLLQEALGKPASALPPSLQQAVPAFAGSLLSGLLSVSLLYFFDYSKQVQKIVEYANQIKDEFDVKLDYYTQVTNKLTKFLATMEDIDYKILEKEVLKTSNLFDELSKAENLDEENTILRNHLGGLGIKMPYNTKGERDKFMTDKSTVLKF